jgi:hypothetical protein
MAKRDYLLVVLGVALAYAGVVQSFGSMGSLELVLLWGLTALVGIFVLLLGVNRIVGDDGETEAADPEDAPSKTGPRF